MTYHRGTLAEFNEWHEGVKTLEGITPDGKIGFINSVRAPEKQRTTAYSDAIPHPTKPDDYIWNYGDYVHTTKPIFSVEDAEIAGWILTNKTLT